MSRFLSWLALGVAATFLVVVSVSFSSAAIAALAFAISIGTLIVSAGRRIGFMRPTGSVKSIPLEILVFWDVTRFTHPTGHAFPGD